MPILFHLREFVQDFTRLIDAAGQDEERIFTEGQPLLASLIADDSWLPAQFAQPHPARYQQYLLHCDPLERFSVLSSRRAASCRVTQTASHPTFGPDLACCV